jgi:hypothetical protein
LNDNHPSATEEKVASFNLYKDRLIEKQRGYAHLCNADYEVFTPDQNNYVDVQFYKLFQTEKLLDQYDEVLYLDLDVIPKTEKVIFDEFDLDNVSVYQMPIGVTKWLKSNLKYNLCDSMNKYYKLCCKKAMLLLDDIAGNETVANTGVFCLNKNFEYVRKHIEKNNL